VKSLGNFPDPFRAQIDAQPEALRRAANGLREQAPALERVRRLASSPSGPPIVLTGMGSSYDACYPATTELASRGIAGVMVDAAELLHFRTGILSASTLLVVPSQSGESAEPVRLAEQLRTRPETDRPILVSVTNGTTNTLARLADVALDTRAGPETGPSTMTFAGSLVVLGALARLLGGEEIDPTLAWTEREGELAASAAEEVLARPSLAEELATWLSDRDVLVLLGRGPARAAAEMGALTLKEAVGMAAESFETAQFRHGPLELAGERLAAMVVATEPQTRDLDVGLAEELAGGGAAVLVVEREAGAERAEPGSGDAPLAGVHRVAIGEIDRLLAPAISIIPAQLLAWRLAVLRGRDPGSYRHASKVTTRE
jgi:glutamine---fructose-6-phosphate transaminase (isomerizing)